MLEIPPLCLQNEEIHAWKARGLPVLYDQRVKGFQKWDMVLNIWEKITENLSFIVENSNFIRGSMEAAVGYSVINLNENTCGGVLL